MKITYTARKVNLKDNFKERAEKKLLKFAKIFSEDASANIVVTLEKNRQTVEVTIKDRSMVYRAEATEPEMNEALDRVVDILGRQIRKNKAKLSKKLRSTTFDAFIAETAGAALENESAEEEYKVVRKKMVNDKPISVEEAILEMNMVNHTFYMFINADTNEPNVVYARDNGDYGLLQLSGNE